MLTAPIACEPMPGPAGAAWPAATPGTGYCGPYPSCCPPAPDRWAWAHTVLLAVGSDTALYAVLGLMALLTAVFIVIVRRDVRRIRARREARQRGRA